VDGVYLRTAFYLGVFCVPACNGGGRLHRWQVATMSHETLYVLSRMFLIVFAAIVWTAIRRYRR